MSVRSWARASVVAMALVAVVHHGAAPARAQSGTTLPDCVPYINALMYFPIEPGSSVPVRGEVCEPDVEVVFTVEGRELGRVTVDSSGWFSSVLLPLPADLGVGTYTLVGTTPSFVLTSTFVVEVVVVEVWVAPPSGVSGAAVTVLGEGCDAGSEVVVVLGGSEVARDAADDAGQFVIDGVVPSIVAPGPTEIVVRCGARSASTPFTVLPPPEPPVRAPVVDPRFAG